MIRKRSKKMAKVYRDERIPLVKRMLEECPWCQRCMRKATAHTGGYPSPEVNSATVVHEKQSRGRGGSITDESNCVVLCGTCHQWIHSNPRQATEEGWLKSGKKQFSFRS